MSEYKTKSGMHDNRIVKENHQQGIERVKQRRSDYNPGDCEGHNGKMGRGSKAHWKRNDSSLTPKKA